jgi:hypothetical protein
MITYNVAGNSHGVDEVSLNLVQNVLEESKRMDVRLQWGVNSREEARECTLFAPLRRMEHDFGSSQSTKKAKGSSPICRTIRGRRLKAA